MALRVAWVGLRRVRALRVEFRRGGTRDVLDEGRREEGTTATERLVAALSRAAEGRRGRGGPQPVPVSLVALVSVALRLPHNEQPT